MKRRLLLWSAIAAAAISPAAAGDQPLVFDGLESAYSDGSEVGFWLRNAGPLRLYLNSFCPDRVSLERLADDGTWISGEMWCCANAGVGSPQSLPPGGSVRLRVATPYRGRFRIRAEYSAEVWGSIVEIPKQIEAVVSPVFDVSRPANRR